MFADLVSSSDFPGGRASCQRELEKQVGEDSFQALGTPLPRCLPYAQMWPASQAPCSAPSRPLSDLKVEITNPYAARGLKALVGRKIALGRMHGDQMRGRNPFPPSR